MDATLSMVGVDRRTAAVDLRERIAPLWPSVSPQGAIPLTTCLRCETYMLADDPERVRAGLVGRLATHSWLPAPIVRSAVTLRTGRPSVEHLFSVAAGLESPIVGERQILDQVRRSWDAARAAPLDARLDRLFQHAVGAGRRVRRDTGIGQTAVSLARTAAGLAAGEGDLGGGAVTVLGAGAVARSAALALADRGARTFAVAGRSAESRAALGAALRSRGAHCVGVPWTARSAAIAAADLVVCATGAPGLVLTPGDVSHGRIRIVIDLASPRDVDPGVGSCPGVRLIDLEAVWREAGQHQRIAPAEVARAHAIVAGCADTYMRWLAERRVAPAIAALRARGPAPAGRDGDRGRLLHQQTLALKRLALHAGE
jgi:glutamyl-tRNA reductase